MEQMGDAILEFVSVGADFFAEDIIGGDVVSDFPSAVPVSQERESWPESDILAVRLSETRSLL
jgi:hypothetical protein